MAAKDASKGLVAHLSSKVFNTPLMINRAKLDVIMAVVGNWAGIEMPMSLDAEARARNDMERAQSRIEAGNVRSGNEGYIAVISVHGSLVQRSFGLMAASGLQSYASIREEFDEVMADPSVKAILFDIDSPGGEVSGCFDLVDRIYASRGRKPIVAFSNEIAFSAAFAIASACDQIFLPRTGAVGSVGVIAVHVDQSKYDENKGLSYTHIFAGARKADFSPHRPLGDDAASWLQSSVDETYSLFVETVARNRGMSTEGVRRTEAGVFEGQNAVDVGLADAVKTWDQTIAYITEEQGGNQMIVEEIKQSLEAALAGDQKQEAAAMLEGLGFMDKASMEASIAKDIESAELSAEEIAIDHVIQVFGVCQLGGMEKMFPELAKNGATIDEAREAVLEAKARQEARTEIRSTLSPVNKGGESDIVADARRRAEARK